jgi:hypothetical protein
MINSQVQDVADPGNSFGIHDVEFGFAEGRSQFILNYFDFGAVTDISCPSLMVAMRRISSRNEV